MVRNRTGVAAHRAGLFVFRAPSHTGTMGPLGGSTDALAPNHTGLVASPAGLKNVRLFKQPPTSFPPPAIVTFQGQSKKMTKFRQNRGCSETNTGISKTPENLLSSTPRLTQIERPVFDKARAHFARLS